MISPTRLGKSSLVYLPLLLAVPEVPHRERPLLVIADPKHELLALTGTRLKTAGYQVHPITFDDTSLADRWNQLKGITDDQGQVNHQPLLGTGRCHDIHPKMSQVNVLQWRQCGRNEETQGEAGGHDTP
ncbi:MAG: hypothetical protein C7B45_02455 [Sulfobacillus acidophilus]|uniref:Uncharacterized protein n=1 Tax=Sulfobacillus acidophilus TaxID=53633 RepID=A0A2T2WN28_9FIRM|nr:MAG: hypothetical protein C7B45_02455 [Sulfobacillus acidophilus]